METAKAGYQKVGLGLGPLLALLIFVLPAPADLAPEAWLVVGIGLWMATWWATEAIPVPATSLIPLVAFPVLGVVSITATAAPYAHPVIFLLLGGFIMAMAMQRWNLHRRIALNILSKFSATPAALIGGFMVTTALLSMWISNTATTLMMVPIALSAAAAISTTSKEKKVFTVALLLGVAYSASIGGFGTLVGTPPNIMVRGFIEESYGIEIGFTQWMMLGVPVVICLLPMAWVILTRVVFPMKSFSAQAGKAHILEELEKMGTLTTPERRTAIVFGLIALSWITRPLLQEFATLPLIENISDTGIAVTGALLMFLVPSGSREKRGAFLLDWESAVKLPWGVILLFGGGLSLAAAIQSTGLSIWIGDSLTFLTTLHVILLIGVIVTLIVFLTELTSNTATTAAFLPILGAIAVGGGIDPILLAVPAALAASCAFMLPVATGPNAIVFASGKVSVPEMTRGGIWINFVAIFIITAFCYALIPLVFG